MFMAVLENSAFIYACDRQSFKLRQQQGISKARIWNEM